MTRVRMYAASALAALLVPALISIASAQTPVVTVTGVVRDASNAPLAQVTVEAVAGDRAIASATTAETGQYRLDIPSGVPVALRLRRDGFADAVVHLPGATKGTTHDVTMQVGRVSDTLVVTASRGAEDRGTVMESVTVRTRTDIEAMGAVALADVLRTVPGVSVEGIGREGAVTSMFARGGESDYNLVLIDGVRVNASGGLFDFSRVSAAEIERVEVVRGAQSALWGSDAMGSVVQVFTRRGDSATKPRVFGSVEGGTFDSWRGDLGVAGGAHRRFDYQAGVTFRRTDGAFQDRLPQNDWYEQTAFDGGFGATITPRVSVRTTLRVSNAQGRSVGNVTFGSRDTGGEYDTQDLSWHATVNHTVGTRFAGSGSVSYFRGDSVSRDTVDDPPFSTYAVLTGTPNALFPNGTRLVRLVDAAEYAALNNGTAPAPGQFLGSAMSFDFPFESQAEFRRPAVRYQGDVQWANGQRLSAGYEWERETNPLVDEYELQNNAFFVQQQSTFGGRYFVTAGIRVDDRESYDTFVSPKLSAGAFLVPLRDSAVSSVKVFGNLGKGIKSPNFSERFGDAFADPSPDLKVERARTADIGVEATLMQQRFLGTVTYFNNDYRDQVAYKFGPVGDGIPEYINIEGSEAHGWELEGAMQKPFHGVTVSGNYSFVDTQVVATQSTSQQFQPGQPLLRRPKNFGSVRGAYAFGRATVHGDLLFVGQRHDSSFLFLETVSTPQVTVPMFTDITVNPGYTLLGLGADVRVDRSFTVFIRANNVTDTEYDSVMGYPGLPRTVTVGARMNLGK